MKKLLSIENEGRRRAFFIALLSGEMTAWRGAPDYSRRRGCRTLHARCYRTGDIDTKGQKDALEAVLTDWGFVKEGRVWSSREYDLYIDWLGGSLDEGASRKANK